MITTADCLLLNINDLLRNIDRKETIDLETCHPLCDGKLHLKIKLTSEEQWILFSHIDPENYITMEYYVYLLGMAANIGGIRYFFLCPVSGERCINLYSLNGSQFMHRMAHEQTIYHPQQAIPSNRRVEFQVNYLEKKKVPMLKERVKRVYHLGTPTKAHKRVLAAESKLDRRTRQLVQHIEKEAQRYLSNIGK